MEKIQIVKNQDCILGMREIQSESVDIIIADPPYNIGKDFGNSSDKQNFDKYLIWCDEWINECIRIIKPNGLIYIYGFSETLAYLRVRIPINVRWIVWHYQNPRIVPHLSFFQRSHESILCCYKEKPRFDRDSIRQPYNRKLKNSVNRSATSGLGKKRTIYTQHPQGKLPLDVLQIAGGCRKGKEKVNHPSQKPLKLCEQLIKPCLTDTPQDILLVVPFAGSGSECVCAKQHKINFIGFEVNPEYVALCNDRLKDFPH